MSLLFWKERKDDLLIVGRFSSKKGQKNGTKGWPDVSLAASPASVASAVFQFDSPHSSQDRHVMTGVVSHYMDDMLG